LHLSDAILRVFSSHLNTNALRGFNEIQHFDYFLWQNVNSIV
jgi:hypothetical protein